MKNPNAAHGGLAYLSFLIAIITLSFSLLIAREVRVKHSCADSGHNFEARYNKVIPDKEKIDAVRDLWETISKADNARGGIDLKFDEIYQGEVCTYCGMSDLKRISGEAKYAEPEPK